MIKYLTILVIAVSSISAVSVKFSGCRSHGVHGTLTTVDVEPCPAEPCALPHGKNITLRATFTPSVDSNTFKSSVHGIILGLPVPYGVPHGSLSGPIVSGQEVTYTNTLYVSPAYPKIRLNVEWEVLDDHHRDLFCFIIPVHITS
ncbi:NPC intracellular cholesterol transporter 2-like isoform X1 [Crassostrea angulata]|uniref:MD-2-related lipid-recognition domain-containing protein n=1 Tax=Magallana gigas TaxID=29159 RepID=A0A8W8M3Z7_MAGGI|nr:NPC intracellular cholesterol transporter 2-like isoform X1 [Crassostrea gigas]XP_052679143.1 NPC intracellular cholesterol transporter 2-like isoform X1 [Crassostrea angulata]